MSPPYKPSSKSLVSSSSSAATTELSSSTTAFNTNSASSASNAYSDENAPVVATASPTDSERCRDSVTPIVANIGNICAAAHTANAATAALLSCSSSSQEVNTDKSWWQKSFIRRSVPTIQNRVRKAMKRSEFFSKPKNAKVQVALFHRREIQTGRLLGTGGFSEVFEITGFILDPHVSASCTREQQELRVAYAASPWLETGAGITSCRFALKQLRPRLLQMTPKDFARAAADLVLEAEYMVRLNHKNILAVRALPIEGVSAWSSNGDRDGYFIITDRLDGTVGDAVKVWKRAEQDGAHVPTLLEKMDYAQQVASALHYLHSEHRIVFRDLKPQNMGFTVSSSSTCGRRGVQLFDFGLCRELPRSKGAVSLDDSGVSASTATSASMSTAMSSHDMVEDDVYQMSGVGTRRYMAPEIINDGRYNAKVDVYSWSMVTWELVSGCRPYASYNTDQHRIAVCQQGERPRLYSNNTGSRSDVPDAWPEWLQTLFRRTWCESIADRWSMEDIVRYLHSIQAQHHLRNSFGTDSTKQQQLLHSPVGVCDFDEIDILANLGHLTIPDLSHCRDHYKSRPLGGMVALNPRLLPVPPPPPPPPLPLPSQVQMFPVVGENSSSFVVDSCLLGLTLCLDEGIEVCASGMTLTLSPTTTCNATATNRRFADVDRQRLVASCSY